jgi:hypothetical protein
MGRQGPQVKAPEAGLRAPISKRCLPRYLRPLSPWLWGLLRIECTTVFLVPTTHCLTFTYL